MNNNEVIINKIRDIFIEMNKGAVSEEIFTFIAIHTNKS